MSSYSKQQHYLPASKFNPASKLPLLILLLTILLAFSTTSTAEKTKPNTNTKPTTKQDANTAKTKQDANTATKPTTKQDANTAKTKQDANTAKTKQDANTDTKQTTKQDANTDTNPKMPKGHLRPFGESGSRAEIEVRPDFPKPYDFLVNYVQNSKPFKLAGVVRDARATTTWTDEYLLSLPLPETAFVNLETKKKENRSQGTEDLHFHEFLRIYNHTEHYMVDDVPSYLRPDIWVPCSLQCEELIKQGFAFAIMWFSSGGTKSVVHTDAFDNIICLYRGQKTFVMMDPARDRTKIDLDTHEAFSKIDVDSVDLREYPGLADGVFYHVTLTAGDCLYVPYRWIHQVRSYGSNIAVNFWWDHHSTLELLQGHKAVCQGQCDPTLTLSEVTLHGEEVISESIEGYRDWLKDVTVNNPMTPDKVLTFFAKTLDKQGEVPGVENVVKSKLDTIFRKLDFNKDGMFTTEDVPRISDKTFRELKKTEDEMLAELGELITRLEQQAAASPASTATKQEL